VLSVECCANVKKGKVVVVMVAKRNPCVASSRVESRESKTLMRVCAIFGT